MLKPWSPAWELTRVNGEHRICSVKTRKQGGEREKKEGRREEDRKEKLDSDGRVVFDPCWMYVLKFQRYQRQQGTEIKRDSIQTKQIGSLSYFFLCPLLSESVSVMGKEDRTFDFYESRKFKKCLHKKWTGNQLQNIQMFTMPCLDLSLLVFIHLFKLKVCWDTRILLFYYNIVILINLEFK